MPIGARRTFRLGLVVALSLALGYGMELQFPFFAPVFGLLLTATPAPPPGLKGLLGLTLLVTITLGVGLVVTPLLGKYPVSALLIIAAGIYLSTYISVGLGKAFPGMLLALGFALIPAVGLVSYGLAHDLIEGMLIGVGVAIVSQWIAYPFFPEDPRKQATAKPPGVDAGESGWIALRAVLIIFPPLLLCLSSPSQYVPIIAKCVMLTQQGSTVSARSAGRYMIAATFLAGGIAIVFWLVLKICPSLWMFFLWMLLVGIYCAGKLYGVIASRFPPAFWSDVVVNVLILLGPAVMDSETGKDVYRLFAIRFGLFVGVTLYAWFAFGALEWLRARHRGATPAVAPAT
jgi:hypothetical protein